MSKYNFYCEEARSGGVCGVCDEIIGAQSTPPELKFGKDEATGKGLWYVICNKCLRKAQEKAAAEAATKKHEQQEAAKQIAVVPAPTPEPTPIADVPRLCEPDGGSDKPSPIRRTRSKKSKHNRSAGKLRAKRA